MQRNVWTSIALWAATCGIASAQDGTEDQAKQPQSKSVPTIQAATIGTASTVYCNVTGKPTAAVPGLPGVEFKPSTTATTTFDRPFGSPNGNWVLTGLANLVTTLDEVIIANNALITQEGTSAPFDPANNIGTIDTRVGINDAGEIAFGTNTAPTTVNDDYIVKVTPSGFTVVAQESLPTATIPGVTYDDVLGGVSILSDGTVAFEADGIDGPGITTANDEILEVGATLTAQVGVTIPAGQAGGATATWQTFDFEDVWYDPSGANVLIRGDTNDATTAIDDVLVFNGAVVLQEGQIIPGSAFVNPIDDLGLVGSSMDNGGNWYARGNNDLTEDDWVVRNGVVVAEVGQPIFAGSTELWDDAPFADCFFAHTGNSVGDYVIGGVTDNIDPLANGVLVLNGATVLCRESDPVDLDNNGLFDDGAFFNTFGNDDIYVSDAGVVYFTATLKDGAGAGIGQGFFAIDTACGTILEYGTGCSGSGGFTPELDITGCAKSNGNISLSISGGLGGSSALLFVGVPQVSIPVPNTPCTLVTNPLITISLPLFGAGPGNGAISFPAALPPAIPPVAVFLQAFVIDGGVPHGFSNTNGVAIAFP